MHSPTVETARAVFRQNQIPPSYSGPLHLTLTIGVSLLVAFSCAAMLENVKPLEWLTIPAMFFYANLSEYLGHRGPMHNRKRGLGLIFERHTLQHHAFFTDESMLFDTSRDFKAVLFPPLMLLFFFSGFALPIWLFLYFLTSPNVAYLAVLTGSLYYLNYELLHFAYHMDPNSWVGRLPFMDKLRTNHTVHHNKDLMNRYNFNITYPICDRLFGTRYEFRA